MEIKIALIAVAAAWGGSIITGLFNCLQNKDKNRLDAIVKKYRIALNDVRSFYELEKLYITELKDFTKSTDDAVKKRIRKQLRESDIPVLSPSRYSTPSAIEKELEEL